MNAHVVLRIARSSLLRGTLDHPLMIDEDGRRAITSVTRIAVARGAYDEARVALLTFAYVLRGKCESPAAADVVLEALARATPPPGATVDSLRSAERMMMRRRREPIRPRIVHYA